MNQKQLLRLCRLWQKRLRLQDWEVYPQLALLTDLSKPDRVGECLINPDSKEAIIRILEAQAIAEIDGHPSPPSQESILVHELLHIHTSPLREAKDETPEENCIHALTRALVEGYAK